MINNQLYFDIAATTPLNHDVADHIHEINKNIYGNASSVHQIGQKAHNIVARSRKKIADLLNCKESEIYFTSGGSESNNIALRGSIKSGDHFITSSYEHPAVSNVASFFEKQNIEVSYINPNANGIINPNQVYKKLKSNTKLISIMLANNEIGSINPLKEITSICKNENILIHTDAVQCIGKKNIDIADLNIDLLSLGAHKFYGPKGIGALYIKNGTSINPLILGGGQEKGISPGTENVALISGMAYALEIAIKNIASSTSHINEMESLFLKLLNQTGIKYKVNGDNRLPGFLNITFFDFDGHGLLLNLDMRNIAISFGSACSSGSAKASHALLSIGMDKNAANSTVRITIGNFIKKNDIINLVNTIKEIII
jgi:cysteine desulfurase